MRSPSLKWRYPMIMHPAEGKGFFHGLHLLNAGQNRRKMWDLHLLYVILRERCGKRIELELTPCFPDLV
jgi:hypothetical protein